MTDRTATNVWEGDLFSGTGTTSLDSSRAAEPLQVTWPSRAKEPQGRTSPEELIAAAHASCFNMALANVLTETGTAPQRLETTAVVTFSTDGGPHISAVSLTVRGDVPDATEADFRGAADAAKDGCPVSKLMTGNVKVTVGASLA